MRVGLMVLIILLVAGTVALFLVENDNGGGDGGDVGDGGGDNGGALGLRGALIGRKVTNPNHCLIFDGQLGFWNCDISDNHNSFYIDFKPDDRVNIETHDGKCVQIDESTRPPFGDCVPNGSFVYSSGADELDASIYLKDPLDSSRCLTTDGSTMFTDSCDAVNIHNKWLFL